MNCPYCNYKIERLVSDGPVIPEIAPMLCGECVQVSLLIDGSELRKPTDEELAALKSSLCWTEMVEPMREGIRQARSARNS